MALFFFCIFLGFVWLPDAFERLNNLWKQLIASIIFYLWTHQINILYFELEI